MTDVVDEHGRHEPPLSADPVRMVAGFHRFLRETLIHKCAGLSEEQLRWSPVPSGTSLLSILKHSINVEQYWFHYSLAGVDQLFDWTEENPDADWLVRTDETFATLRERYHLVAERTDQVLAQVNWDDEPRHLRPKDAGMTAGWILTHMVEEVGRHCGHADLIRELIDGSVGE